MAWTTLPHWTIGAVLAIFGTAVAAELTGEATHNVVTVGGPRAHLHRICSQVLEAMLTICFCGAGESNCFL
jgi:hypothetical protein